MLFTRVNIILIPFMSFIMPSCYWTIYNLSTQLFFGPQSEHPLKHGPCQGVNAYDCEGRTPIMLAMDRGNRRLFQKIVREAQVFPRQVENRLGVGITSKISKVEKKSNLDVLDKRGWNVVIYAIETQMLTDAGSWDLILAIPCCPRHHGCHAVVDAQKQRSIRCWWSWARMQPSSCELETRRRFEIQTLRAWVLGSTCFMTC